MKHQECEGTAILSVTQTTMLYSTCDFICYMHFIRLMCPFLSKLFLIVQNKGQIDEMQKSLLKYKALVKHG